MPTLHLSGGAPATRNPGGLNLATQAGADAFMPHNPFNPQPWTQRAALRGDTTQGFSAAHQEAQRLAPQGEARGGGIPDFSSFLSNLMPSFPGIPGQQANQRQARQYPTTPPPLSPEEIRAFEQRRRNASRQLQQAEAHAEHQRGTLEARFEDFERRLRREGTRAEGDLRTELAGRGQAFAPRTMGRGLADLRDMEAEELSAAQSQRAEQMAALDRAVQQAELAREREFAQIDADKAMRRTDLSRLIQPVGV